MFVDTVAPGGDPLVGWNDEERSVLQSKIAARLPFQNFSFTRANVDGSQQRFRVSGEPMFDLGDRYTGYRGIGQEMRL